MPFNDNFIGQTFSCEACEWDLKHPYRDKTAVIPFEHTCSKNEECQACEIKNKDKLLKIKTYISPPKKHTCNKEKACEACEDKMDERDGYKVYNKVSKHTCGAWKTDSDDLNNHAILLGSKDSYMPKEKLDNERIDQKILLMEIFSDLGRIRSKIIDGLNTKK